MLNEFEKAEKINPTVAYSIIGYHAVDLYTAIGNKAKADALVRTLQRMETERKASVTKKQQSVRRQVKTNKKKKKKPAPKKPAPMQWYEGLYFRGGGHF